MTNEASRPVLLVGSVALASADEVFREAGRRLGKLAPSLPDGETGERLKWVGFFSDKLAGVPGLELAQEIEFGGEVPQTLRFYRAAQGRKLADIDLGSPGYADIAAQAYVTFLSARGEGEIADGVRFQVSLPSPLVLAAFFHEPLADRLELAEKIMFGELDRILLAIPHQDLAIQWDLALETESEEARRHPSHGPPFLQPDWSFDEMIEAAARLGDAVPADAKLGFHLCYGNPDGKHIIEPVDTSVMRDIGNALVRAVSRTIDWIHMPVPLARDDDAYFAPLGELEIPNATQIYLGVVHEQDGPEGAARRLAAAERHLRRRVGIATECGMGRRKPGQIPALLDLHRTIATARSPQ